MSGKRCVCWLSVVVLASFSFGIFSCSEDPATPEEPVKTIKIYAFAGAGETGIIVIDCSNPSIPDSVGVFDPLGPSEVTWLAISGDYLYAIVERDYNDPVELFVIDISDPVKPARVGSCDIPSPYCEDITVSGDYAYGAAVDSGLVTFDISQPTNPRFLDNLLMSGYAIGVEVSGNYAYTANVDGGLHTINIADPSHPLYVANCGDPYFAVRLAISGNYAYVSNEGMPGGLYVIDIDPPSSPDSVGFCALPIAQADPRDIMCVNDYAYLGWEFGFLAIDISTPTNPTIAGGKDIDNSGYDFDILDNLAYFTADEDGLHIIDISDPTNLRILGTYKPHGGYDRDIKTVAVKKY